MPSPSRAIALLGLVACGAKPPPAEAPDAPAPVAPSDPAADDDLDVPVAPHFAKAPAVYGPPPTFDRVPSIDRPVTGPLDVVFVDGATADAIEVRCGDHVDRAVVKGGRARVDTRARICDLALDGAVLAERVQRLGGSTLTCRPVGEQVRCEPDDAANR